LLLLGLPSGTERPPRHTRRLSQPSWLVDQLA